MTIPPGLRLCEKKRRAGLKLDLYDVRLHRLRKQHHGRSRYAQGGGGAGEEGIGAVSLWELAHFSDLQVVARETIEPYLSHATRGLMYHICRDGPP